MYYKHRYVLPDLCCAPFGRHDAARKAEKQDAPRWRVLDLHVRGYKLIPNSLD
jgi:hypothetical protein